MAARFAGPHLRILEMLCGPGDFRSQAPALLREASQATGCEVAVLRVGDSRGDCPCFCREGPEDRSGGAELRLFHRDAAGRLGAESLLAAPGDGSLWTNVASGLAAGGLQEMAAALGCESAALIPLRGGGEIAGFLQIGSRSPGRFDREALRFLEQVAGLAARAVRTMHRLEELAWLRREVEEQARGRDQLLVMSELASSLAHEVKNPLAGMTLAVGRLTKALQNDAQLGPIAGSLGSSINSLSERVDRITAAVDQPSPVLGPVDVNRVLEDAVRGIERRAGAQGLRVVRRLAAGLPRVSGDEALLRRAFLNALGNALEAMPSGGVLRLESSAAPDGRIEVLIADNGPGLAAEQAEVIFKPFRSTKPGHAGLGLIVMRRVLELHGGEAVLRPGAGGGAEAVVRIPAIRGGGRQP